MTASVAHAQCDGWFAGPFGPATEGADNSVIASCTWDPDGAGPQGPALVIGGFFTQVGGIRANRVAYWDGAVWRPLGNGLSDNVLDLIVFNGDLYACGRFPGHIARWHLGGWVPQAGAGVTGLGAGAYGLGVYNGELILGGHFTAVNGVAASNIARFDGATWRPLAAGITGGANIPEVWSFTTYNGELIAGGIFESAGGVPASNIARWNGAAWQALGPGVNGLTPRVLALTVYNGALHAGGSFAHAGSVDTPGIARWNGSEWSGLGSGITTGSGAGLVRSLALHNGYLVAGGGFTAAGGLAVANIARWNGSVWSALSTGIPGAVNEGINTLLAQNATLLVGGVFSSAGGIQATNVAHWNGSAWSGIFNPWFVHALAPLGSRMVAGGFFGEPTGPGGGSVYHIASWNGSSLTPMGQGVNAAVRALTSFANPGPLGANEIVAGGDFTIAGGAPANRVAHWVDSAAFPPPEWEPLAEGFNASVYALERFDDATFAAGAFTASGAAAVNRVARWDGSAWQPLGDGCDASVFALRAGAATPTNLELIAGGDFTSAGSIAASRIARWSINPSLPFGRWGWSAMGAGFNGTVSAIERYNNSTYAAGSFTASGATAVNHIARWNGSAWTAVGAGLDGPVFALKASGGFLYAAGAFSIAGGVPATRVARWDGAAWSDVRGGADNVVLALGSLQGEIHAGGTFEAVQNGSVASPGWARYSAAGCACYANCDNSTSLPVLNVNDFICFQSRFAAGESYANCDGSTTLPVLNVNDFICFQTRFAAGCP